MVLATCHRYAGVLEVAVRSFCSKKIELVNLSVYLSHDLAMLRLIETFSESAPQMVLMQTVMLQTVMLQTEGWRNLVTGKVLHDIHIHGNKLSPSSSLLYFTWNLLLIFSRVAALTLFAYTLPCYILAHFLCWWAVLFFVAWYSKATFMDCAAGELLYQATVGLIWYFSWFNAADGPTLSRCALYHAWMLLDTGLLCGLACWRTTTRDAPWAGGNGATALSVDTVAIMSGCVGAVYVTGLLFKLLYYKVCHPTLRSGEPEGLPSAEDLEKPLGDSEVVVGDVTDGACQVGTGDVETDTMFRSAPRRKEKEHKKQPENRRMKRLAQNFYS
ncbi:hypothetical protein CRUP_001392 [Coryphaenoides rupestris]|nr:hypothetical protein CRUP_001392 [Coryphaenoides rupestris]